MHARILLFLYTTLYWNAYSQVFLFDYRRLEIFICAFLFYLEFSQYTGIVVRNSFTT